MLPKPVITMGCLTQSCLTHPDKWIPHENVTHAHSNYEKVIEL